MSCCLWDSWENSSKGMIKLRNHTKDLSQITSRQLPPEIGQYESSMSRKSLTELSLTLHLIPKVTTGFFKNIHNQLQFKIYCEIFLIQNQDRMWLRGKMLIVNKLMIKVIKNRQKPAEYHKSPQRLPLLSFYLFQRWSVSYEKILGIV